MVFPSYPILMRSGVAIIAPLLAASIALASPQVDRLTEQAGKGDRAAIKSLVELARKKDADAEYALGLRQV